MPSNNISIHIQKKPSMYERFRSVSFRNDAETMSNLQAVVFGWNVFFHIIYICYTLYSFLAMLWVMYFLVQWKHDNPSIDSHSPHDTKTVMYKEKQIIAEAIMFMTGMFVISSMSALAVNTRLGLICRSVFSFWASACLSLFWSVMFPAIMDTKKEPSIVNLHTHSPVYIGYTVITILYGLEIYFRSCIMPNVWHNARQIQPSIV